jgi:hypothetical protein
MNKDEYKQLYEQVCEQYDVLAKELAAIKQARALDKMAENARELGLDYEPVGLIDRLKNPEQHYEFTDPKKANAVLMSLCQEAADALAAQQEHEPENEPYVSLASVQPVQATMKLESSGPGHGPAPNQKLSVRHVSLIDAGKTPPAAPVQPVQEPEIVQRVKRYAGQTMRTARNPNITARECIELANWIVATPPAAHDLQAELDATNRQVEILSDALAESQRQRQSAQRQWFGLTEDESDEIFNNWPTYNLDHFEFAQVAVAKVFEKNLTTKVTVPDVLNPKDENFAYAAGWNDCRAEMLKGNTP